MLKFYIKVLAEHLKGVDMEEKIKELIEELEDGKKIVDDFIEVNKDLYARCRKTQLGIALTQRELLETIIERLNEVLESEE